MAHVLLTNDDGIDSPALAPMARALRSIDRVEVVVPDRERSWISKAITRHDEVRVEAVEREGIPMWTTSGYPADCVQIGVHGLYDEQPRMVVSGINIGFNFGAAYILSSGTVGAASEAGISGVPAMAFSTGTTGNWSQWAAAARGPGSTEMWERLSAVASHLVSVVMDLGFPEDVDVINVNLPEDADLSTERHIAPIARVGYDRLFTRSGPGTFIHDFGGSFLPFGDLAGTDVDVVGSGAIAVTPMRVHQVAEVSPDLRRALEG